MKRIDGGVYLGPWTVRMICAMPLLALVALVVVQLPDIKRYIKFELM